MKQLIGRIDRVDLPDFALEDVKAKIDTGANSSSIHASYIKEVKASNGDGLILRFCLLGNRKLRFEAKNYDKRKVKSSNGHVQERFMVKMRIKLFGKTYKTDVTLAQRKEMKYPILLGRKLLRNRSVVDVSKHDLSFELKQLNA